MPGLSGSCGGRVDREAARPYPGFGRDTREQRRKVLFAKRLTVNDTGLQIAASDEPHAGKSTVQQ